MYAIGLVVRAVAKLRKRRLQDDDDGDHTNEAELMLDIGSYLRSRSPCQTLCV